MKYSISTTVTQSLTLSNRYSLLAESRTCDRKVASSCPGRSAGEFSSQVLISVLTLIRCPFHPCLPQWHVKDPGHSAKSAGSRLHLNTHTTLTQRSGSGVTLPSRQNVGIYQGNEITGNSFGHIRPVLSARWATVDWFWPQKWNWCARADLYSPPHPQKKKKGGKKCRQEVNRQTFPQSSCKRG